MSKQEFNPDYAVPPGETLLETIQALELTQKELALRMGRPVKTINEIIKGVAAITAETSLQLEKVTGVPASFWNNAEANYRERLARLKEQRRIETQTQWLKSFSYRKIVELGLVPPSSEKRERVENLLRFFGVASEATVANRLFRPDRSRARGRWPEERVGGSQCLAEGWRTGRTGKRLQEL